jgi:cytochrome c peroxidase
LQQQALDPLTNPREHGLANVSVLVSIVSSDAEYAAAFSRVFGGNSQPPPQSLITVDNIVSALAEFERTLLIADSPFDRYQYGHVRTALSPSAVRGLELFRGRAQCAGCHLIGSADALFTDNLYHSLGVGMPTIAPRLAQAATRVANASAPTLDRLIAEDPEIAALGRFVITKQPRDIGKFKTPSLRNVALTAPYMHDGSVSTLTEAVDVEIYYRSLESGAPLILTPEEKRDLVEFLTALTSPSATSYR